MQIALYFINIGKNINLVRPYQILKIDYGQNKYKKKIQNLL